MHQVFYFYRERQRELLSLGYLLALCIYGFLSSPPLADTLAQAKSIHMAKSTINNEILFDIFDLL